MASLMPWGRQQLLTTAVMLQQLMMPLLVVVPMSLTVTTTLMSIIQQTELQAGLGCVLASWVVLCPAVAARVVHQLLLMVATEMGYQQSLMASVGVIGSAMTRMEADMVHQLLLMVATEAGYQLLLTASVGVNEVEVVAVKMLVVVANSSTILQDFLEGLVVQNLHVVGRRLADWHQQQQRSCACGVARRPWVGSSYCDQQQLLFYALNV